MKYPVSRLSFALREIYCFFMGHNWKNSWRQRSGVDDEEYPKFSYAQRQGNPYFEYSVGWHYRCRRCRLEIRGDEWYPLWKCLWFGILSVRRELRPFYSKHFRSRTEYDIKFIDFVLLPINILESLYFPIAYYWRAPWFMLDWLTDLKFYIYSKLETEQENEI